MKKQNLKAGNERYTLPIEIVNEDGTALEPPVNPLLEKWNSMIPDKYGNGKKCSPYLCENPVVANYSCVLCHEKTCHYSEAFEVPEEDKEAYEKWQQECDEYDRIHNHTLWQIKHGDKDAIEKLFAETEKI